MARELMSHEENYCFDVAGYLIVRGVLTPKEVETCNRALDQGGQIDGMLEWPAPLRHGHSRRRPAAGRRTLSRWREHAHSLSNRRL
jgi:hypothetical protein